MINGVSIEQLKTFKAADTHPAMIANCTDIVHDPKEVVTTAIYDKKIPYKWEQGD